MMAANVEGGLRVPFITRFGKKYNNKSHQNWNDIIFLFFLDRSEEEELQSSEEARVNSVFVPRTS